jgi:hypothetical protein
MPLLLMAVQNSRSRHAASFTGSMRVASSLIGFELFTRFDTAQSCRSSLGAGVNASTADVNM